MRNTSLFDGYFTQHKLTRRERERDSDGFVISAGWLRNISDLASGSDSYKITLMICKCGKPYWVVINISSLNLELE